VSLNNTTKGPFGHVQMHFTVVLLHFVQIDLNLKYREGYKCKKVNFKHIFTILPLNYLDLDLITVNIYNLLKEYNIVYNIKMLFSKLIRIY